MNNKRVIAVHGIGGISQTGIFPEMAKVLKANNVDYDISAYPGGLFNQFPRCTEWLSKLDNTIKKDDKPLILIGYSLGARTVLLYLEKNDVQVDSLVLISAPPNIPALGKLGKQGRVASFFEHKIDMRQVRPKCKSIIQLHGTNDFTVPYYLGKHLSRELETEFLTFPNKGHFNKAIHFMEIAPIILSLIS